MQPREIESEDIAENAAAVRLAARYDLAIFSRLCDGERAPKDFDVDALLERVDLVLKRSRILISERRSPYEVCLHLALVVRTVWRFKYDEAYRRGEYLLAISTTCQSLWALSQIALIIVLNFLLPRTWFWPRTLKPILRYTANV